MALTFDPNTGVYIDPATGQVFKDQSGTLPADPGLTQQAQRNLQFANQLASGLGRLNQDYRQAQTGQSQLGQTLNADIAGTAPSVAGTQLRQGLEQIQRGADSQASGATGTNAGLARYGAIQASGAAGAEANQDAAMARVQERANAIAAKGQLLGQQQQGANQMYATNVSGANAAAGNAAGPAGVQAQVDQADRAKWLNFIGNMAGAAGAAGVTYATRR